MKKFLQTLMLGVAIMVAPVQGYAMGLVPFWPSDSQIQAAMSSVCAFVPTAATIETILHANGAWGTANEIATVICGIVAPVASTAPPAGVSRLGVAADVYVGTVTVNGQPVAVVGHKVAR